MDRKLTSILTYWTIRYFSVLFVGLLLIAVISIYSLQEESRDSQLQTARLLAEEIADHLANKEKTGEPVETLDSLIEDRKQFIKHGSDICVIVTGQNGKLLFSNPKISEEQAHRRLDQEKKNNAPALERVTAPILYNGSTLGEVTLLQPNKSLFQSADEIGMLVIAFASFSTLGWLTIYLLSRKMSMPIRNVAQAAERISHGDYNVQLANGVKERELNELVASFGDMAKRLQQLEHSREFMLAGLTHELKTPVTSVKGLVYAVREGVVTGQEAEEFLDIALQETNRLQRMIADLLDYNALTAGVIHMSRETVEAGPLLGEIVHQWSLLQPEKLAQPELSLPVQPIWVEGDALRIQQIITNLLNNSAQASQARRNIRIQVSLQRREDGWAEIRVTDNGIGITPEERELVFQRFYRGEDKKQTIRGLGLGLTFSKLLANGMDGDLELLDSSPEGSTFALRLRLVDDHSAATLV
ncbi:HAMP domain-containing histidine kinase [Paenibacillus sp. P96]|uniref:histidine kinase n=1 Tax=Paenibacillus zeirhizosphaerae TaxID=2987519 RepID=A0ABT9FX87_9BACL|nr:HAMP domain-containing sensor histidine kinase [Paenibacillus sp. P96]MDP4099349.1 HAMP domain-containing histidine kinase [Paenibacillus sp. P96]